MNPKIKKYYKTKFYCGNCGKNGHTFKNCTDAVISYGMLFISIASDDPEVIESLIQNFSGKKDDDKLIEVNSVGIEYNNFDDIEKFCRYKDNIRFLMIRRKHTLGYIEFIRGRYNIDHVDGIIFLFCQMTPDEIEKIGSLEFDDLWENLWSNNKNKSYHFSEYQQSKQKFQKLKTESADYLNLSFYVQNVNSTWKCAEWGFPKGRRNFQEEDIDCAIREFKEESGFADDEYILLDKLCPIKEKFIGTNGVSYKHIYYVSFCTTNRSPTIDPKNKTQNDEIGAIGWFTFEEAMNLIRPYHLERKKILTQIYMYLLNNIVKNKQ